MHDLNAYDRFCLSYSGIKLPLKLVSEIDQTSTENRNTFFAEKHDNQGRPVEIVKLVYGEVALCHQYTYAENGALSQAVITDSDGETSVLDFTSS